VEDPGGDGRLRTIDVVSMEIRDLVRLRKAKDRMDREFEQPLDVPALAQSAAMSTGHFSRSFKAAFGESPYSYLMTRRIERAKALLRRGDTSVTDACFAVGCTSLGSFSSRFTELVGESPSAYRARSHLVAAVIPSCVIMVMAKPSRNEEAVAPHRS
jgi:transcriptional regulator GlxA family with amidase domain